MSRLKMRMCLLDELLSTFVFAWGRVQYAVILYDCMVKVYFLFLAEKSDENQLVFATASRSREWEHTCTRACKEGHEEQPYKASSGQFSLFSAPICSVGLHSDIQHKSEVICSSCCRLRREAAYVPLLKLKQESHGFLRAKHQREKHHTSGRLDECLLWEWVVECL